MFDDQHPRPEDVQEERYYVDLLALEQDDPRINDLPESEVSNDSGVPF